MTVAPPPGATAAGIDGSLDLSDPGLYAAGEPHAIWRALRSRQPILWQPVPGRGGFWAVTTYGTARQVLSDHATFTSRHGSFLNLLGKPDPAGDQQFSASDPPRHGKLRQPVQRQMTAKAVHRHAESLRTAITRLLEPRLDGAPFDFAATTAPLQMAILGPLLGIPDGDWPLITRLVAMAVAEEDPDYQLPEGPEATLDRAHRELFGYLLNLVIGHRRAPRGDLVDVLLSMAPDGVPLTAGAVVANCYGLLLGAAAAIPHVPNATLLELIRSGGYAGWADRPELLESGVEEALRWATPARHLLRYATRDTRLSDVDIATGQAVVVWLGSANRDEQVFPDSYTFDAGRSPNRHLSFSDGHHYCIGANMVRLALRIFFAELFARFSSFELAGDVRYIRSNWLAGVKHLPVVGIARR